jgi:cytochrome b
MDWVKISAILNLIKFVFFLIFLGVVIYFVFQHSEIVFGMFKGFKSFFTFFDL